MQPSSGFSGPSGSIGSVPTIPTTATISDYTTDPLPSSVEIIDKTDEQDLGVSIFNFSITAQNGDVHIHNMKMNIANDGGPVYDPKLPYIGAVYLYNGSQYIQGSMINNGVASFDNIDTMLSKSTGSIIPSGTTSIFTVKVDVFNIASSSPLTVSGSFNGSDQSFLDSNDNQVTVSGSVNSGPVTFTN